MAMINIIPNRRSARFAAALPFIVVASLVAPGCHAFTSSVVGPGPRMGMIISDAPHLPTTVFRAAPNGGSDDGTSASESSTSSAPLGAWLKFIGTSASVSSHVTLTLASALLALTMMVSVPQTATADLGEYGVEIEAPTVFTGESVLICVKRGPLGACKKTEVRTAENDNDKASKYFVDPGKGKDVADKDEALLKVVDDQNNALIARLKQQTSENKERNDRVVKMKTLENNLSASYGPFSQQVVITNADGDGFTVLENPQAMRLKKLGYIKNRKFVTQPTEEVIAENLEAPENSFGDAFKAIFAGKE